ncbi:MAG: Asp-tRNA(Asn)/Glu-tRNA(Gln) amidotransferase subunit GatB [Candidatus Omnitrophica bacterium]|nr:Asp-tRNA(Asn)/Glu-tRNA(Gln) amidotransferase subunit GatB [Candidatus Omnitrophota bacterium]
MNPYEAVVGIEMHLELSTQTKIFCGCSTRFGAEPNSQTCPVCLGLPGTLPVLNRKALEYGIKVALALHGSITPRIKFDRKNYFYPDLPKNYQISQYDLPLCTGGFVTIETEEGKRKINIRRVHLEEDTGKLVHLEEEAASLLDFNRSGIPLLEIVSEPDLRSPEEAHAYVTALKAILEYLEVSNCNMEEGSLRCDTNVSVRQSGSQELGVKVEIKNLNSFRAVKLSLQYEITRQIDALEKGEKVFQETRLWDAAKNVTLPMRSKEYAHDYRYFPEPDLVPFILSEKEIQEVRKSLPELPEERIERFKRDYSLSSYDAGVLTSEKALSAYYEASVRLLNKPKLIANWIMGPVLEQVKDPRDIDRFSVSPERLVELLEALERGEITQLAAKKVLDVMVKTRESPQVIIQREHLAQIQDVGALDRLIREAIEENPKTVSDYHRGKESAMMYLIGQVMKKTKGSANPEKVNQRLKEKLEETKK